MNTLTLNHYGQNYSVFFRQSKYVDNNSLYVGIMTEEDGFVIPWSNLTVNLETTLTLDHNCAFIDTNNNGNEIISWLVKNKLGKPTGRVEFSGWCVYPEFEFDMKELDKYTTKK